MEMKGNKSPLSLELSGISKFSESVQLAKVTELSIELSPKIVLQTLSSQSSLKIANRAKKHNPNIYQQKYQSTT